MNNYTLLQWNIWYKENYKNVIKYLKQINADIVTLQEVTQNSFEQNFVDVVEELKNKTNYNVYYKPAHYWYLNNKTKKFQGNAILSKFPFKRKSFVFVQNINENNLDDYRTEGRVYVECDIELNNSKSIIVGTTHLSYNHKFKESELKSKEENRLLKAIAGHKNKFILSGDFNVDEDSRLISELEQLLMNAGPNYSEKTWTTKPFDYNGFRENNLNWRLDYVFSTPDINIVSAKILKTDYSDHLPIFVKFKL